MDGGLHRSRNAVVLQHRGLIGLRDCREALLEVQPVEHGATMESAATEGEHLLDLAEREARCATRVMAINMRAMPWIGGGFWHAGLRAVTPRTVLRLIVRLPANPTVLPRSIPSK